MESQSPSRLQVIQPEQSADGLEAFPLSELASLLRDSPTDKQYR